QGRGRCGLVGVHPQQGCQVSVGRNVLGPRAVHRVPILDRLETAGLQPRADPGEVPGRITEVLRAGVVVAAALEQRLQRGLQVDRALGTQGQVVGNHGVEQYRTRVGRVAGGVLLGDAGTVGDADQVQLRYSQPGPYPFQVADVVGRAVEAQVGGGRELVAAVFRECLRGLEAVVIRITEGVVAVPVAACQQVGAPGPARVHQQYVAVAQDVRECRIEHRVAVQ